MTKTFCTNCKFKSAAAGYLNAEELDAMENNCAEVQFNAGDIIFRQDALSSNVVYLKAGLVKLHIHGPLKEKIMKIAKAPTYLCLPSNFGDKVNHFSATAIEKTEACFIDVNLFRDFIYKNGDFAYQIIIDLSRGELENFHGYLSQSQKQMNGRVAEALLLFSKKIYESNQFRLPLSRNDFGDLVGISRESASRILTEFHNEKIIQMAGRQISILKEDLLQKISSKG
jgi:CRP-like cAMP-binding protein